MKNSYIVKNITSHFYFLLILGYMLIGTIVYTTWFSSYKNAFTICLSITSNLNYQMIFIFPSFLLLTSYVYKKIADTNFITRFKTRKAYFKFLSSISFKCNSLLFIMYLLIIGIAINLLGCGNLKIEQITYSNNLVLLIVNLIKIYFFIYLFQRIIILLHIKCKNTNIANIIGFSFLALLYTSKYFLFNTTNPWINSIIPTNQLTEFVIYFLPNIWLNIIGFIILFSITFTVCIILFHKIIKKKEFLERE